MKIGIQMNKEIKDKIEDAANIIKDILNDVYNEEKDKQLSDLEDGDLLDISNDLLTNQLGNI